MKTTSYIKLQEKYGGQFVALYKGKVIAKSKTSKGLFAKIVPRLGDPHLVIQRIERKDAVCVYRVSLPC